MILYFINLLQSSFYVYMLDIRKSSENLVKLNEAK